MSNPKLPNILVAGTPGTGKTLLCSKLAEKLKLKWQDVSAIAKENNFTDGIDDELECPILDEDKLLDYLEPIMAKGGNVVEYHGCDFFPERWFQAVFVTTCNNTILYDRLVERKYNPKKIQSNVECEIFGALLEEAKDSYDEDVVFQLKSETQEDLENNVRQVEEWFNKYTSSQKKKNYEKKH